MKPMPSEAQHLHPLSWLFIAGVWLKGVVVPAVVLLLVSGRGTSIWSSYETWLLVLVIPAFALAFIKFWVFRYTFAPGELVIRDGILVRNERHIPYDRIQNMDLVQNPLHRMLSVALVRLETAGGDKPEAQLRVLSLDAVDRMRSHVFSGRGAPGAAEMLDSADGGRAVKEAELDGDGDGVVEPATDLAAGAMILSMSNLELVKLGLISNRGLVVVAAMMGLAWQWQFDWWNFGDWNPMGDNPSLWESELRELCFAVGLLAHVANIDAGITSEEREDIGSVIREDWGLSESEAHLLVEISCDRTTKGRDYHRLSNGYFECTTWEHRREFVKTLFRIANAAHKTGNDEIEGIRDMAKSLKVSHKDFIAAKKTISNEDRNGL